MNKICVIIEGQLRGSENCGPTIKKFLVEPLKADLYFYVQNYEKHDDKNFNYYGEYKEKIIYDNPSPNFEDIFNNLASLHNIDKSLWKKNFNYFVDKNYKLGYDSDKPGTCIRRMYNRHLIYEKFKEYDYDWFILLRSDMYFYENFHNVLNFSDKDLYAYKLGNWQGINNNLIVFNKNILKKSLNYIFSFLNNSLVTFCKENNFKKELNEERFFKLACAFNNLNVNLLDTIYCFISGNKKNNYTTWTKLEFYLDYVYKYEYDFEQFLIYIDEKKNHKKKINQNSNIHKSLFGYNKKNHSTTKEIKKNHSTTNDDDKNYETTKEIKKNHSTTNDNDKNYETQKETVVTTKKKKNYFSYDYYIEDDITNDHNKHHSNEIINLSENVLMDKTNVKKKVEIITSYSRKNFNSTTDKKVQEKKIIYATNNDTSKNIFSLKYFKN